MVQALDVSASLEVEGQGTCQCEVCGKAFDNDAALRAHRAKMHSAERMQAAPTVFDRRIHGTDGVPKCSGCGRAFERWADLRKHIEENHCQGKISEDSPAAQSVQDMVKWGHVSIQDICRDGISEDLRKELLQHCSMCRQWFPNDRYVKQHWSRVHKSETQLYMAEAKQWRRSQFGPIKDNCSWCRGVPAARSDHRDTCPVLFQLSMIWVQHCAGEERKGDDDEEGIDLALPEPSDIRKWELKCQICEGVVTARGLRKHMDQKHNTLWHKARPLVDKLCSSWSVGLRPKTCQFCHGKYDKRYVHALSCHAVTQTALERVRKIISPKDGGSEHGTHDSASRSAVAGDLQSSGNSGEEGTSHGVGRGRLQAGQTAPTQRQRRHGQRLERTGARSRQQGRRASSTAWESEEGRVDELTKLLC